MTEDEAKEQTPIMEWRFKLGVAMFALSIALPILGVPILAALSLSEAATATVSGALLVGAEILGLGAVAVMGKNGYNFVRSRVFSFLKRYGPPKKVSRTRYRVGLVMIFVPVLFGWISIYAADFIPGFGDNPLVYGLGGDFLLLAGLFVVGGDFWGKLRALFVYQAEVNTKVH